MHRKAGGEKKRGKRERENIWKPRKFTFWAEVQVRAHSTQSGSPCIQGRILLCRVIVHLIKDVCWRRKKFRFLIRKSFLSAKSYGLFWVASLLVPCLSNGILVYSSISLLYFSAPLPAWLQRVQLPPPILAGKILSRKAQSSPHPEQGVFLDSQLPLSWLLPPAAHCS